MHLLAELRSPGQAAGFRMAHALPMRLRREIIGAINVFSAHEWPFGELDVALAQALADIGTIGTFQERAVQQATLLAQQLEGALSNRIVIEQAKGLLARRLPPASSEPTPGSPPG